MASVLLFVYRLPLMSWTTVAGNAYLALPRSCL
jgi:hypothetical protein